MAMYAQTSGTLSTTSGSFVPIHGLTIVLPEGAGTLALVTLNLPMPYALGDDYPGGTFGISVNDLLSPVQASFSYSDPKPESPGRMPTTLVVGVPLAGTAQKIIAVWLGIRGSKVIIDSPSTLSAVFG
jgi:mannose-binding lectin